MRRFFLRFFILVGILGVALTVTGVAMVLKAEARTAKAADASPLAVWLDARQGGDAGNWALPGANNYFYDRDCVLVQMGSVLWSGSATNHERKFVTLPQAYAGGNTPIVFVNVVGPETAVTASPSPLFSAFYIDWRTTDGSTRTAIQFNWMTVGLRAGCSGGQRSDLLLPFVAHGVQ